MNKRINKTGFTLVETLMAVGILSLSILATFTAVQSGLRSSSHAKEQVVAYYLAQEAMEYIKNIRDENALKTLSGTPTHWLHGLSEFSTDPCWFGDLAQPQQTCRIDVPAAQVAICGSGFGTCPNITQNTTSSLYGHTTGAGWVNSIYKREIQFSMINSDEVKVTIRMSWTTRGSTKSFQTSQLIFNRQ